MSSRINYLLVLHDLRLREEAIERAIVAVETLLACYPPSEQTIAEAIEAYLIYAGSPQPSKVITESLMSTGFPTVAQDFGQTVRTTLSTNPRFHHTDAGWQLAVQ